MKIGDRTNDKGQRAGNCLDFCHIGKYGNCQRYDNWQDVIHDCDICHGKYCEHYDTGKGK